MAGTPLVLLSSAEDWEEFKRDISTQYRVTDREISWTHASDPTSYPCLVSAVWVETSVVCLFVYPQDVDNLINASRANGIDALLEAADVEELTILDGEVSSSLPVTSMESLWNRHMVALLLTIVHEMVSVGITKQERFEGLLSSMLKVVDIKHASDIEAVKQLIKEQFDSEDKGPPA